MNILVKFGACKILSSAESFKITCGQNLHTAYLLDGSAKVSAGEQEPKKAAGKGVIFGLNAIQSFKRLLKVYETGGTRLLVAQNLPAFWAVLTKLETNYMKSS